MNPVRGRLWSGLLAGLSILLFLTATGLEVSRFGFTTDEVDLRPTQLIFTSAMLVSALTGSFIVRRMPSNPVGWLLAMVGLMGIVEIAAREYAILAELRSADPLPLGPEVAWFFGWSWVLVLVFVPPLLLLFPDGKLLSPRWRWALVLDALFPLAFVAEALYAWPDRSIALVDFNYVAPESSTPQWVAPVAGVAFLTALALSAWSLIVRYRRADGTERHQVKWLASAGVVLLLTSFFVYFVFAQYRELTLLADLSLGALPVAVGIAVLKYRLYDIDIVINKALVYGSLAGFITAIYVGIAVGLGSLIGVDEENLGLSIVATALIAVAFQPFKQRVQRLANRLVYGQRSTPYEVLADFSSRMAGSSGGDELLHQMAETLADGTGAASAHVWLKVGDQLRLAASFHREGETHEHEESHHAPISVSGGELDVPGSDRVVPVAHKGELLGALAVAKRPGEELTPVEDKLMGDLAAQAGVVLRNVRLTEELLQRLEELKASRQRLVTAQDKARRRLERDLHDGAQQQLVALKVKLSLAQRMTTQEKVKGFLTQLQAEADDTLQTLRDLARGIYPPLLADKGLEAALVAQANKSALDVEVKAENAGRYAQEVEAAVYFCCLEALQNVAKYAGECRVVVTLTGEPEGLLFEVSDDGCGFDPATVRRGSGIQNMLDRMDALGGSLEVTSSPDGGTTVRGRVPARALQPA